MKKVILIGAAGRMGQALVRCLQDRRVAKLQLFGAVDLWDSPYLGQDMGLISGTAETGVKLSSNLAEVSSEADVLVDFSFSTAVAGNAERIAEWGIPWVIGTTGIDKEGQTKIERAAKKLPVVMAPNMSLGVNVLFALTHHVAKILNHKGYDVEIIERHHRRKKDAPSGTALGLGEAAASGMGWNLDQVSAHGRHGTSRDKRPDKEIGFHAVRGGDFIGDHTVLFAAEGEAIELSHRATSRDTFAVGALRAAAWVTGQTPGLYSMKDVLGL